MNGEQVDTEAGKVVQPGETPEEDKLELAAGGEDLSLEQEAEDLQKRLSKLSKKDRRRTIDRLAALYPEEGFGLFDKAPDVREKVPGEYQFPLASKPRVEKFASPSATSTGGQRSGTSQSSRSNIVVENNYKKLKTFSSKTKPGSGELDYRHWRRAAVRVIEDEDLPRAKKRHLILDSLQGKAEDLVAFIRDQSVTKLAG